MTAVWAKAKRNRDLLSTALSLAFVLYVLVSILLPARAHADETAVMRRGDAAMTAFSGTRVAGEVPDDVSPLDRTFLDLTGPVIKVFDLGKLGAPPDGEVAHAPMRFFVTAGDIGQVFGVAVAGDNADITPDLFTVATSLYGLQIVSKDGERLVNGEPGARWMAGQFGTGKGGGPGSVWKIDGETGAVSLLANIKTGGRDNAGPGLAGIAYDAASKQLFVADLETGLIHRLARDGSDKGTFDHGVAGRTKIGLDKVVHDGKKRISIESADFSVEKPETWGYADPRRRVTASAVEGTRLYYAVADGPAVWSVGLTDDGDFADDARLEIDVTHTPTGNIITGIAFDGPDTLYLAQRGELTGSYDYTAFAKPQASAMLRYVWDKGRAHWSEGVDEVPVGLEPPHRSTLGGVALGYGYTAGGDIDYGRCRETLWSTGEHLREGDDLASSFARTVHGLQGNAKSLAQPLLIMAPTKGSIALDRGGEPYAESGNAPPREAWFVDYDGLYEDTDTYGHVGAVAIFSPCDERIAAEEPVPPPSQSLPLSLPETYPIPTTPGIHIGKQCLPGPIGGSIPCRITVTNIGIGAPSGPITFSDFSTILAGPGAGGAVLVASATPDGLDWLCTPTPTASLSCALPQSSLPPGASRSVTVVVDTGPLLAAGNHGFRNCAVLGAPYSGIACDEGATEITVTKTAPASCLPGNDCTFGITVANTGLAPFSGDVLLTDSLFVAGAAAPAPITAIVPALACAPAPAALPFSCTAPLALAPGESRVFTITVTMPAAPANYWARNCFAVSAPAQPPPALPPVPGSPGAATSCDWVPVGAPGPLSNLIMKKSPLACDKLDPDTVRCDYDIVIRNEGPSDFNAPLTFTETMPPSGVLSAVPAPWACAPGPPAYACTQPGAVAIAAGTSIAVPVSIDIPRVALEAAKCWAPNKAEITTPAGGVDANFETVDDSATATADAALIRFEGPGGLEIVLCDPTNLKTTKVAKGDCAKAGDRFRCEYTVTTTNMGPDPHKGDIKINETFSAAPASVSFSAPWGCVPAGAGFTCTYVNASLAKGESVELTVVAEVADNGRCELANTATMTFPPAGTRWNQEPDDDTASATAGVPSPRCEKRETCEKGETRTSSGRCVAIETTTPVAPARLCPDGSVMPRSGICPCPFGTVRSRSGRCMPVCIPGPNEARTVSGRCVCRLGYVRRDGRCVRPSVCKPGQNEVRGSFGRCVCKEGYRRNKDGRCVRPDEGGKCPDGTPMPRNKVCPCPEGTRRSPSTGRCVPVATPEERCKEKGWIWRNGRCIEPSDPAETCRKKGWTWRNGTCVEPSNAAEQCKKKGGSWDGKSCTYPPSPEEACTKRGGTWNGKTCAFPPSPAEQCKKNGGKWDGKSCTYPPSPAESCAKRGGTWNGKTCIFPPSPAEQCKKKGGKWDGKRCTHPPSPAETCAKRGGKWIGTTCVFPPKPAEACKKRGGVWNGKTCVVLPKACPSGTAGTPPNCKRTEIKKNALKPLPKLQLQEQRRKP